MDLTSLINMQITADEKRGFSIQFGNDRERVTQLTKDLVGLFGEIGEFANLIKKVEIKLDHPNYHGPEFSEIQYQLREEVIDVFIYLIRLAAILETDLEAEFLKKFQINQKKYESINAS